MAMSTKFLFCLSMLSLTGIAQAAGGDILEITHATYVSSSLASADDCLFITDGVYLTFDNWLYVTTKDAHGEHRLVNKLQGADYVPGCYGIPGSPPHCPSAPLCENAKNAANKKARNWRILLNDIQNDNMTPIPFGSQCWQTYILVEVQQTVTLNDGTKAELATFTEKRRAVACPLP